ncbi:MAG: tetratricopeptide repeat protein [Rikenellaceae bacterium]
MSTNKKVESPEETIGEAMSKTELFIENNGKKITSVIFGLFVLAALIFGFKVLILEPKLEKATAMIANAQTIFEQANPDYQAALDGDANGAGFLEVIGSYSSTPAGNVANHYAGICYLQLGDLDAASKYLSQYKAVEGVPAQFINAQNLGLQGDIAVEKGDYAKALTLYAGAVGASDNLLTAPNYMRKSALVAAAMGDNAKAVELYEAIISTYPSSIEARDAEKYLGAIK